MEEDPPMSLVDDRFDDETLDDRPVDGSFYNEDELCEEEEVQPTSENFSSLNRYKPSQHTPGQLPTIREEKNDDSRSNNSSRAAVHRPSPSKFQANQSDNSHDISSQFQFGNGINEIEKYTENFYSKQNEADRLFPENLPQTFASPPMDKQNSWEPSVCHYEKQPTPEVITDSPGGPHTVFGHLNRQQKTERIIHENEENIKPPISSRISPERNNLNSPLNSTKFLDTKTSTPKRPGISNRLGNRQPPQLELSTIYALSPQRGGNSQNTNSLFGARPTQTSSVATPSGQTTSSDTMLSNRTISESMVVKVFREGGPDADLMSALENARKKREKNPVKPDFRVGMLTNNRKVEPPSRLADSTTSSVHSSRHHHHHHHQKSNVIVPMATVVEMSNMTNLTSNMSKLSTAKSMMTSREDLSRISSSKHHNPRGSTNSTMMSQREHIRDGRESVSSMRTVSRASSTVMTASGATSSGSSTSLKPLRLSARRLAFGVVPVAETLTMEVEIENVSDRQCQVRCSMDSKTTAYQILDNKMMMIEPGKSTRVRVSFCPTSIGRYQVWLIVEVQAQNWITRIPVWGVGGVAIILPNVSTQNVVPTGNPSEFAMYTTNLSHLSFKLENVGVREGFALVSLFDSSMNPLVADAFRPSRGVILRRSRDKRIDVYINASTMGMRNLEENGGLRTSSAMSTASSNASTATCGSVLNVRRRATSSGADLVIQVAWGDEIIRQRLKQLEIQTGQRQLIDGIDFTSFKFADEMEDSRLPQSGIPHVMQEDLGLFASSYRTLNIFVFSSQRAFSAFRTSSTSSARNSTDDVTILETTAFRQHTFVNDATMMPPMTSSHGRR